MAGGGRLALLVCVLAMHLMPLAVQGKEVLSNGTEPEVSGNLTALLPEEAEPDKATASVVTVTGVSSSAGPAAVSTASPRVGRLPRAGEQDGGSGIFTEPVDPVNLMPVLEEVAVPPQISPDSAENEHLLPSNTQEQDVIEGAEVVEEEEEELHTAPPWIHNKDTAVFNLDRLTTTMPPPSTNPPSQDVLHVAFFDPSSHGRGLNLAPPSPSSMAHELQGGDPTSWAMPDNYDYLTPYDDGVSPTAEDYYMTTTDAYESDVDLRLSRTRSRIPGPSSFLPGAGRAGVSGPVARPPAAADGSDGRGGCRIGYQRVNGSCRSPCDLQQNYCLNGGQCYLLEGMGVFCRCNIQDYMWNKGTRCESVVTEFQVMCLAVGASAVVLLLLFMIIVCFAKKLHVLKTENKKLRRRSKYRPSSEQHNDNFSLSTIAEGSHPNDDPHSQNKLEDPVKAPPKEDDSLNIHNSLTPKPDHHKVLGEENSEVNSLHNNMM